MEIQYFIVGIIVVAVILWQFIAFCSNEKRINRIKKLFPENNDCTVVKTEDSAVIYNEGASGEFKEMLIDINSYLVKNKDKTFDYQIIKEIVNRNSQSLEDEVDTMLSTPLYLGLIATIFGIAFGVVVFAWRDLSNLLAGVNMSPEGIKILLTDVGIAMAASLCGVLFTKISTSNFNDARTFMAKNKNKFLSWIQTELMSKLSDDITGAIIKMTHDLNTFNSTFAKNTAELKETLKIVKDNYGDQVKLLEAIEKIKINKIAEANIKVYDRLQGCTDELESLFEILSDSETYVAKVVELNENLGNIEERTKVFEEVGNYFKNEIEFVKDRQGMMRQQMTSLDSVIQEALANMGESLPGSIEDLSRKIIEQNDRIEKLIEEQQNNLVKSLEKQQKEINEKIGQIENPFEGLKDLVDQELNMIKETFSTQNASIKEILSEQNEAFKKALKEQQETVIKDLKDAPNQLKALSDISKSVDNINQSIASLEVKQPQGLSIVVTVCAVCSFFVLLAILLLQIFGL